MVDAQSYPHTNKEFLNISKQRPSIQHLDGFKVSEVDLDNARDIVKLVEYCDASFNDFEFNFEAAYRLHSTCDFNLTERLTHKIVIKPGQLPPGNYVYYFALEYGWYNIYPPSEHVVELTEDGALIVKFYIKSKHGCQINPEDSLAVFFAVTESQVEEYEEGFKESEDEDATLE